MENPDKFAKRRHMDRIIGVVSLVAWAMFLMMATLPEHQHAWFEAHRVLARVVGFTALGTTVYLACTAIFGHFYESE